MKKVVLLGGSGTVGVTLAEGFKDRYNVIIMDQKKPETDVSFIAVNACDYEDLVRKIPADTDAIVNLLRLEPEKSLDDKVEMDQMTLLFFQASYYLYLAAVQLDIPKVVFASSNHVTDCFEEQGRSLLGREINVSDPAKSKSLYGVLKYASEQVGQLFVAEHDLAVISIRIGSMPAKEQKLNEGKRERLFHTQLLEEDAVELFRLAIETTRSSGTYYGVSGHPDKPWSTLNAVYELGFKSQS
ncbi:UDP-glucose 4-epimerase [Bacillus sp. JCM 19046]|nr:UDP-glucose 4-epimerase [Bacillus sp. JCM 19045]GAF17271.1 UDP-glucose 4-epimerase [Bacillus sp. JCM 19046]